METKADEKPGYEKVGYYKKIKDEGLIMEAVSMKRKRISRFFKLPMDMKFLFVKAFFISAAIRFSILFISFKKLAGFAGKYKEESPKVLEDKDKINVAKVSWVVNTASKFTPWESKCLVKAMTAQILLKRYKVSSTLYLGVAKDKGSNKLLAHAWLRAGENFVTGGNEKVGFKEVARFSNYHAIVKQN